MLPELVRITALADCHMIKRKIAAKSAQVFSPTTVEKDQA
jgi:hypothetical protein